MPVCHGWNTVQPESCNTALQKVKEVSLLGQTVLGRGMPPLLQTRQGGSPGTLQCSALLRLRSQPSCCPAVALPPLLGAELAMLRWRWPLEVFSRPAQCGPKTSPKGTSCSPGSPRTWGTHRYILHWGHVANVQLGLMRVQPRHQRRERQ